MATLPKDQAALQQLFLELLAPWLQAERTESLRAAMEHKGGQSFARLIAHGEAGKFFGLREFAITPPADAPCLHGCLAWEKGCYADDSPLVIAPDGSWLSIRQELEARRFFARP